MPVEEHALHVSEGWEKLWHSAPLNHRRRRSGNAGVSSMMVLLAHHPPDLSAQGPLECWPIFIMTLILLCNSCDKQRFQNKEQ
ncbi:hypothetical protein Tsubulata_041575 [Turnera subulata]|uniref:Uncharacterized protein n=1 Tax=Turnera subulata TaxID=218843 RepID=A0A9Q0IZF3_9ROSI|nr:hypothetical protein Tsubulata_041575 [Turnera subulata]